MEEYLEELREAEKVTLLGRFNRWCYTQLSDFPISAILFAAALPNPLFSLVGIACGFYKVPFIKFFPANILGKTIKAILEVLYRMSKLEFSYNSRQIS